MRHTRPFATKLRCLLGSLLLALGPSIALAQVESQTSEQLEAARGQMYQLLEKEVAALERQSNVLKLVAKLVRPTVVHIEAKKTDAASILYNRKETVDEAGSGWIVKIGGENYVITNGHVIRSVSVLKNITIRLDDGRQINPARVWSDPDTDIAVMSVNVAGLLPAKLGNSDNIEIGDFVLAVGSPFGLSHSITFGIISALGRRNLDLGKQVKYQGFIQSDAAINPGNSGGPLINLRGEVIGMNTAIASSSGGNEGIGFSIPVNVVMIVARQLVQNNKVVRAHLGVTLEHDFGPDKAAKAGLSRPFGARVTAVTAGSAADKAQLQPGDIILEYGGVTVDSDAHLQELVLLSEIGKQIPLTVFRDQKLFKAVALLQAAPTTEVDTPRPAPAREVQPGSRPPGR